MTARELAELVLQVLDLQREYFRSRDTNTLAKCRQLESQLRAAAKDVLSPPKQTLFGGK